jgi:hypothetical protein
VSGDALWKETQQTFSEFNPFVTSLRMQLSFVNVVPKYLATFMLQFFPPFSGRTLLSQHAHYRPTQRVFFTVFVFSSSQFSDIPDSDPAYVPDGTDLFLQKSRLTLGPIEPPIQRVVEGLSSWVKRPRREADHSPLSTAEVEKAWSYISTLPCAMRAQTAVPFTCTS